MQSNQISLNMTNLFLKNSFFIYTLSFWEYVCGLFCTHKCFQPQEIYTLRLLNLSYLQVYAF